MMARGIFLTFSFLMVVVLSGCWDKQELDELGFVMAIGLDEGAHGKIDATFQIANPEVGTSLLGSPPPDEKPQEVLTVTAPDFLSARNTANAFTSRRLTFSQTQALIISEELARKKEFINVIYSAIRERELRKEISIVITKEKAQDFIRKDKPKIDTRPHKYYRLMIERARETGFAPESDVLGYLQTTEEDADLFLAMYATTENEERESGSRYEDEYLAGEIPRKGGIPGQFIGSAVFKQGKMIGTLTGEETRMALILDETMKIKEMFATYEDPIDKKHRVITRITSSDDLTFKMKLTKNNPQINVKVPMTIEILGIPSLINYSTDLKKQKRLKKSIEDAITKRMNEFVEETQQRFKGEPFHWALVAQRHFLRMEEYESFDWMKTYPNMDIDVDVDIILTEFGQQIQTPELGDVKD
ncbi:Ger(x)C family germination protein [Bacillus fengqiuensis]|nr:Ger(x)C family germination protein [Bacillus fengqiuensis]